MAPPQLSLVKRAANLRFNRLLFHVSTCEQEMLTRTEHYFGALFVVFYSGASVLAFAAISVEAKLDVNAEGGA